MNKKESKVIAIVGKGGVGKTTISTLLARILIEKGINPLLIDADPTMSHFVKSMGISIEQDGLKSLEEIRNKIISTAAKGSEKEKIELAMNLDNIIRDSVYKSPNMGDNKKMFSLIAMGQPQKSGCFCPSNLLMRDVISKVIGEYRVILIDCEAGLEQIHRKVIQTIDYLIIISDMAIRSLETAANILKMANKFIQFKKCGLILNRIKKSKEHGIRVKVKQFNLPLWTVIYEDEKIIDNELSEDFLINIDDNAEIFDSLRPIVENIIMEH